MNRNNYQTLINAVDSFPSLPATATNVLQVVNNPESSANDLVEAILPDQSMCVAILKVANSALFGLPKEVDSLKKAITILGYNEIQSIVLGKAVFDTFQNVTATPSELNSFWRQSFNCGLAALIIAKEIKLPQGSFFVEGLIHDIGKLAFLMVFPDDQTCKSLLNNQPLPSAENREQNEDSFSPEEFAARLLKKWFFPEQIISAVRYHQTPMAATNHKQHPTIIFTAKVFAYYAENVSLLGENNISDQLLELYPTIKNDWETVKIPWQNDMLNRCFDLLFDKKNTHGGLADFLGI